MKKPAGQGRADSADAASGRGARPMPAILDIQYLERQVQGDAELRDELLRLYIAQLETLEPKIRAAPGRERREAAHALKGASLAIGALALAQSCGRLDADQVQEAGDGGELARVFSATRLRIGELLQPAGSLPEG
jgi:HPt (histidine-containing phosphotransfer) domain-containing protein